jgi:hypothetical protein
MALELATAAELIALDMEGRQAVRRAARETEVLRRVFRAFVEGANPVLVDDIAASFPNQAPEKVVGDLTRLDQDDLIRISDGRVDLAYPFSTSPTPFVADLGRRRGERWACCAIDALGLAPMLGQSVDIRSRCHHCGTPVELSVDPSGPGPNAANVMVWVAKRAEEDRRACDSL